MTGADARETGQKIARARRRRGLSQAALAGLVGRSESWLSQVERGIRTADSHSLLIRLADVLRVGIEELTGPVHGDALARPHPSAEQIEQAMLSYPAAGDGISRAVLGSAQDTRNLRARARLAHARYQEARYEQAGRLLPGLITDVEAASRTAGPDDPELCMLRAQVYDTTAALLNRVGEYALAWTAADRAMWAADQSGKPLPLALSVYRLTYVLASRGRSRQALDLAMTAIAALEKVMRSPSPEQLSVYGGLHLAAASAAAGGYDAATAAALLKSAAQVAQRLGQDANHLGTAFGPVNVAIHVMSVSTRMGDARTAVQTGETIDAAALPTGLIGRRTQVSLDLACAYAMRRQDAASVNALLAAEQLSPQLVRFDSRTREVITGLLRREHRASTPQLRPLAHRAGLI